jgi:AraC-like DNA-binding protein
MYLYFDPARLKIHSELPIANLSLVPRLFFENATLWDTAVKLKSLVERPASVDWPYFEALGILLVYELVRLNRGIPSIDSQVRGWLAKWAQQIVFAYIEEHLAERLPITALARLVPLSPYHFCKVFKQPFGIPPHRHQINRRIERAKPLLAKTGRSFPDVSTTLACDSPSCRFIRASTKTSIQVSHDQAYLASICDYHSTAAENSINDDPSWTDGLSAALNWSSSLDARLRLCNGVFGRPEGGDKLQGGVANVLHIMLVVARNAADLAIAARRR